MHRRGKWLRAAVALLGAGALFGLTACASSGGTEPTPSVSHVAPGGFTPGMPSPVASGTPVAVGAVSPARLDAISADLRSRGVTATPTVVSAEEVVWTSGALGCPTPGQSYTQSLIEGMRVLVDAGGTTYDYRFGTSDAPVLCTSTR